MSEKPTNWLKRFAGWLFSEKEPPPTLAVETDGYAYVWRDRKSTVRWSDVKEVFAFKRDIFSVDLICIGFRISEEGDCWEIDEHMAGYDAVVAAMNGAFPGIDTDWWDKVAFPAFKTNLVTIWGQPKMATIWELQ
jgi:hypothetical protein